jgi:LysM repeat protein
VEPFRLGHKPGSAEDEGQPVLDTDAEAQAAAPQDEPSIGLAAAAGSETGAEEGTPPSELEDIPIQNLLDDLVGVSRSLGIEPRAPAEPSGDRLPDVEAEPGEEEVTAAEPGFSEGSQAAAPSLATYRRYALHAVLLSLAVVAAIVGLVSAGQLALTALPDSSPAQSQDGSPTSTVVVATVPGIAPGMDGQPQTGAQLTPLVPTEPTPEPTPDLQAAYFLYTVQPGDAVFAIAETFGISPDYVLWNNPGVIDDPNILLVGQELLIPSVDGIIYRVNPGDTLSRIAALYQIDVQSIVGFAPNGLMSPNDAITGMVLILPGAVPPLVAQPLEAVEPTASQPRPAEPTPAPEAPTPSEPQAVQPTPVPETPTPSEPQAMQPTPTPEAPTPSEPEAVQPTPTADESPSFSIGRITPE